jgi:hypothetical protein
MGKGKAYRQFRDLELYHGDFLYLCSSAKKADPNAFAPFSWRKRWSTKQYRATTDSFETEVRCYLCYEEYSYPNRSFPNDCAEFVNSGGELTPIQEKEARLAVGRNNRPVNDAERASVFELDLRWAKARHDHITHILKVQFPQGKNYFWKDGSTDWEF